MKCVMTKKKKKKSAHAIMAKEAPTPTRKLKKKKGKRKKCMEMGWCSLWGSVTLIMHPSVVSLVTKPPAGCPSEDCFSKISNPMLNLSIREMSVGCIKGV